MAYAEVIEINGELALQLNEAYEAGRASLGADIRALIGAEMEQ